MSFLQHPAFQSLVLPLLLATASMALLRLAGTRWTALGAALGLVIALTVWPGFDWPASSRAQTLPWIALAGLLAAALAIGLNAPGTKALARGAGLLATALVTVLAVALAVWAALGGSLLLAQLALMVGSVAGVAGLWAWRSATITPAALAPLVLAGLVIAFAQGSLALSSPEAAGDAAERDDPYYTPQWK
ncbi:MAG: hypothetical protein AB7P11_17420 [Hydrogenophaga sp.]|uniref:hypothetical protein n=1 Tax=Hydrogenophaga sp. TaxID=1904254 RepID=UPI003D0D1559